ncbi:MAG: GTP-binding protein, partial [SAR324 cluster bacterium]|nr:GTP-binding protein [SAR324 cluster bacterium]
DLRKGVRRDVNDEANVTHLRYELNELKHMVSDLVSQTGDIKELNLHENLTALYQQLCFNGVEEKFAKKLCEEVNKKVPKAELNNFAYVKVYLARMFMQVINLMEEPTKKAEHGPKIISLVGATGVGKTTTLAKIAAGEKLKNPDAKIGLVTVDTYRIAAVAQLKEYAKIIKVPCKVVHDHQELEAVLESYKDMDLILIDTAGRSQRDAIQLKELKDLMEGHSDFTNLLVLSSTTKDEDLMEMSKRFAIVPLSGVIFTKLDESTSYGSIFNHSIRFKLPLAYLTTGQNVPEDIETAGRERLVDLLLNISGELDEDKTNA